MHPFSVSTLSFTSYFPALLNVCGGFFTADDKVCPSPKSQFHFTIVPSTVVDLSKKLTAWFSHKNVE